MKKLTLIAFFAALCVVSSCKKDECPTCSLYLVNSEQYTYQMSVTGMQGFSLKPAEIKEVEIKAGQTYTVTGRPNTYYAHNDFAKAVKCEGNCGDLIVEIKD